MLKTVIIDDEDLIREGLRTTIPWDDLGFELVGEASDGEQAIDVLQSTMPDVIITDIRMPFMNGLELVEFITPLLPDAFIIIISGHDEFHYAQKALQLGVYDFILKPFDLDYFVKILNKIKYEHTLRRKRKTRVLPAEDLSHLQHNFISSLLTESLPEEQLLAKLEGYHMEDLKGAFFAAVLVQIDNFHLSIADFTFDQINDINKDFYKTIKEVVPTNAKHFLLEGNAGDATILLSGSSKDEVEMKIGKTIHQLRTQFDRDGSHSITLAYSQAKPGLHSLEALYRQCHKAANQRFMIGYNQNISYDDIDYNESSKGGRMTYPQIGFDRSHYVTLIKGHDKEAITAYIETIFSTLIKSGQNSSLFTTMFASSVYVELLNLLNKYNLSIGDLYDDPLLIYRNLTISQNLHDTKNILIELSLRVADYIKHQSSSNGNSRIHEAKTYMEAHFNSPDITLQRVAEEVNMGVCYFSSVFKKETGDSFINYLTAIRIEKAKELFETTDLKTYEISYKVGYNTPTYFSTLFKKITGVSPSEFRNK